MAKEEGVAITAVRFPEYPGKIRAYYSVRIGDWIIHEWRLVQEPGKPPWVSYPMITLKDRYGRKRFQALLDMPSEIKRRVDLAILSSWEEDKSHAKVPR